MDAADYILKECKNILKKALTSGVFSFKKTENKKEVVNELLNSRIEDADTSEYFGDKEHKDRFKNKLIIQLSAGEEFPVKLFKADKKTKRIKITKLNPAEGAEVWVEGILSAGNFNNMRNYLSLKINTLVNLGEEGINHTGAMVAKKLGFDFEPNEYEKIANKIDEEKLPEPLPEPLPKPLEMLNIPPKPIKYKTVESPAPPEQAEIEIDSLFE